MFHPISSLPFLLETIEEVMTEVADLRNNLIVADMRNIFLYKEDLENGIHNYSEIKETIPLYRVQLEFWNGQFLTINEMKKVHFLEELINLLEILCSEILECLRDRLNSLKL